MNIRRFYLGAASAAFFVMALRDLHGMFEPTPPVSGRSYLFNAFFHFMIALWMGLDSWKVHRKMKAGTSAPRISHYPGAEAVVFALAGMLSFAAAAFYGDSLTKLSDPLDAWLNTADALLILILVAVGIFSFRVSAKAFWNWKDPGPTEEERFRESFKR